MVDILSLAPSEMVSVAFLIYHIGSILAHKRAAYFSIHLPEKQFPAPQNTELKLWTQ